MSSKDLLTQDLALSKGWKSVPFEFKYLNAQDSTVLLREHSSNVIKLNSVQHIITFGGLDEKGVAHGKLQLLPFGI